MTTQLRKRRWYQFRLRTLLVLPLVLALCFAWPYIHRCIQVRRLASYDSQDIRKLDEDERQRVESLVVDLIPDAAEVWGDDPKGRTFIFRRPWYVWRPATTGPYLIVFVGDPLITIPGGSGAGIYLLDWQGRLVGKNEFGTGYRIDIVDASFDEQTFGFPCVTIATDPLWGDIRRQHYALIDGKVELLRLEDSDGKIIPIARAHRVGPETGTPTIDQWYDDLASSDRITVLRALATVPADAAKLTDMPKVKAKLSALAKSNDPWIREAASSYLTVLDDPAEFWWFP